MAINILGISAFYHDSAAALLRDGEVVAAAQEERFTRRKADPRYPERAIAYVLSEAGLTAADLHYVAYYERPELKFDRLLETHIASAPGSFNAFSRALPHWVGQNADVPSALRDRLGPGFRGELAMVEHHMSHAASAFYPSPYNEAAILTLDAVGEWSTSAIGVGTRQGIELSQEMRFPHSLGMLYSAFTYYTGFKVNSGEYKLMGLAPYGRPLFVDEIMREMVRISDDGAVWLDQRFFNYCAGSTMTSPLFHETFGGPPRDPEDPIEQKHMDLAASIQVVCEDAVLRAVRHASDVTGQRDLVMAGGVALNCVANGRVLREGPFDRVWIQPAAGDAGGALGACYSVWHDVLGNEKPTANGDDRQKASWLGPAWRSSQISLFLDSIGARYRHLENEDELLACVVEQLASEKVVGWFQGRMEFGPRALGARSILGDPRSARMQQVMNLKIKFRESFRPFAPVVLREHAHEIFDVPADYISPYMLFVAPVREDLRVPLTSEQQRMQQDPDLRVRVNVPRSTVPAVTHVDYSARIQTVDGRHGRLHRLLGRFHEETGCPVLVNTSFNVRGEPIVCTPEDAFTCFMATEMDCLVLEDCILLKQDQPEWLATDSESFRSSFTLD